MHNFQTNWIANQKQRKHFVKKIISSGIAILLFLLFVGKTDASQASDTNQLSTNQQSLVPQEVLRLTNENIKGTPTYTCVIDKNLKIHISLTQELFKKPTGIFFDSFEISKYFSKSSSEYVDYVSNFNIKPGKHTLVVDRQKIEINAIYVFDADRHNEDITNTWQSRSDRFATLTKDGIVLKNDDRDYGSFAFKRFYNENTTLSLDFIPLNFQPGVVVYFGDNIYFMINSNNIMTMKKSADKHHDKHVGKKIPIPKIENGVLYKLEIKRNSDTYTVSLNGVQVTTYTDSKELRNQRFRNIGISIPKNGSELLIKKIVIR